MIAIEIRITDAALKNRHDAALSHPFVVHRRTSAAKLVAAMALSAASVVPPSAQSSGPIGRRSFDGALRPDLSRPGHELAFRAADAARYAI